MAPRPPADPPSPTEIRIVNAFARKAVGRAGLRVQDVEDLAQEAFLQVAKRDPRFNPAKSSHSTFTGLVARHAISNVATQRSAARRDWRRCNASLDAPVVETDEGLIPLSSVVADDAHARRLGASAYGAEAARDLRADLRAVLESMPADLQEFCGQLMRDNPTEVARQLGISRQSLQARLRRVRDYLVANGLGAYVPSSGSGGGR